MSVTGNIERASPMPGPWELGDWITSMGDNVYRIVYSGKRSVSAISVYGRRPDGSQGGRKKKNGGYVPCISTAECEATAHLIAAAPELLAALKAIKERCSSLSIHCTDQETGETFYTAICAAITKAEGKQ